MAVRFFMGISFHSMGLLSRCSMANWFSVTINWSFVGINRCSVTIDRCSMTIWCSMGINCRNKWRRTFRDILRHGNSHIVRCYNINKFHHESRKDPYKY